MKIWSHSAFACFSLNFFSYLGRIMEFPPENIKDRITDFINPDSIKGNTGIKIAIGVCVLTLTLLMFPHFDSFEYTSTVGTVWVEKDLVAPFDFPIYKDQNVYQRKRQEAMDAVPPVYERKSDAAIRYTDSLRAILSALRIISHDRASNDPAAVKGTPFPLTDDELQIIRIHRSQRVSSFVDRCENLLPPLLADIYQTGLLNRSKTRLTQPYVAIRKGNNEELIPTAKFYDLEEVFGIINARIQDNFRGSDELQLVGKILRTVITPNLILNASETNVALQIAADNVPRTTGFVLQNERIIGKHERITEDVRLKLESYRRAVIERSTVSASWQYWLGIFFHVTIILGLFALYLYYFQRQCFRDNSKLLLIGIIILMQMFFGYITVIVDVEAPLEYLIFVPAASMLFAIIFNSRIAFYGTVAIAFLIAGMRGNDYSLALASIVAGTIGTYTVRDIRSRTQIFRSLIYIFFAYIVSILAISLAALHSLSLMATEAGFALINAIVSPVLTYGLLFFFERVFKVTTDLTLAELSDLNNPLLIELSEQAPGTFHHSVTIGNLAEAAAEAIGANSILARVGGYYHDIGKLLKPEYFVENQVGPHSRHNRLKPRMSALIISSHVREGIELGRKRGLPEVVLNFIPQHHGTTRISFFYDKALKQAAKKPPKDPIHEEDYLYPGPKPQTKEAGIVMLADSVEASTRTYPNLTPQKLEAAIDNMIKHRFMEGQLDECELTLRDLTKIKEAFLKILIGIHHHRIQYPEQEGEGSQVKEQKEAVEEKIQDSSPPAEKIEETKISESEGSEVPAPEQTPPSVSIEQPSTTIT